MHPEFHIVRTDANFEALAAGVALEAVGTGRWGNHLTRPAAEGVPIVRSTTRYTNPAHVFTDAHAEAADRVAAAHPERPCFDHALLEIYDQRYAKMGYHCDQSLDLADYTFIAILSAYDAPLPASGAGMRRLCVKSKTTDERFELPMEPGTAIVFSTWTNTRYLHKIVLRAAAPVRWLGLTLRRSKTRVRYDAVHTLPGGARLRLADEDERRAFYRLRGVENRGVGVRYPSLDYTISEADLRPPV